jgi:hypothetical protein
VRGLLFNPEVLWGLKVISEDRDNFLNLIVCVLIHEETRVWLLLLGLGIHSHFHLELAAARHLILITTLG